MKEIIQRLMVYMIIVSAIRGLLINKKYEEYFRFFSGLIMLLMLLFPVLSLFGASKGWYQRLEESFFDLDIEEMKGNMKLADGELEKLLMKEYSDALKKEVVMLAKEEGISLKDTEVSVKKKKNEIYISEISGKMGKEAVAVSSIQMGKKQTEKKENDSKKAKKLRKKICIRFSLSKEQVYLWE